MNLSEIWSLSDDKLQLILETNSKTLSSNLNHRNFDRTVVATILYNEGRLDSKSSIIVEHPKFSGVLSSGSFKNRITLFEDYYKVTVLQAAEAISEIKEFQKHFGDYFNDLNLSVMLFEKYYQPSIKMVSTTDGTIEFFINNIIVWSTNEFDDINRLTVNKIYLVRYYNSTMSVSTTFIAMIMAVKDGKFTFYDAINKIIGKYNPLNDYYLVITELSDEIESILKTYYHIPTIDGLRFYL